MASPALVDVINSFRLNMGDLPGLFIPPDLLSTQERILSGDDIERPVLLDYLAFLTRGGGIPYLAHVTLAMSVAGFEPLSTAEHERFSEALLDGRRARAHPQMQVRSVIPRPTDSPVYQLEKQIDELSTQVSELLSSGVAAAQPELKKLQELVGRIANSKAELSAPISFPAPEDMEVKLVSSSSLDRLDEYHGDQTLFQTLFGVFAGAGLGLLIGIVTAPKPSITAWSGLTLGVFVTASAVFLVQALRIRGRASKVRAAALGGKARRVKRHDVAESEPTEEHVPDEV